MSNDRIAALAAYGIREGLIDPLDRTWAINRLLEDLELTEYTEPELVPNLPLDTILKDLLDDAVVRGVISGDSVSRDRLDTKLMGELTPRPAQVIRTFREKYRESPRAATDWYYQMNQSVHYIRKERLAQNLQWSADTDYGSLDLTIHLTKPELNQTDMEARTAASHARYPRCPLCRENEGFGGASGEAGRQNLRVIPLTLGGRDWFLEYSSFGYYREHCILFSGQHTPAKIERAAFRRLLDFVKLFPHYFAGSNADLPRVGGSSLTHDYYQGGRYVPPIQRAPVEQAVEFPGFEDVEAGVVRWPMSVLRLRCGDDRRLVDLADRVLSTWRGYTDESVSLFAMTEGEPHNTITPIARVREGKPELDLVLRNNYATREHPLGIFHPREAFHHIKRENIGLMEVMGLAVLPPRLKSELLHLARVLVAGGNVEADQELAIHAPWAEELCRRYTFTGENVDVILRTEVGRVFARELEDAGVFKRTEEGREAFSRFLRAVR